MFAKQVYMLLQVWDPTSENYITVAAFDAEGTLLSRVGWDHTPDQTEALAL